MDKKSATETELEAAAFRRLLNHLQSHTEVQNMDLMILADFCRNCLAKWYQQEAETRQIDIDYDAAREKVYGMKYEEWKKRYQTPATEEQLKAYEAAKQRRKAREQ
ncbi:MAG: DUF1244 domain-containing protein [Gammaproteobacteria bacterium]|nr:DUF1244 domain-containing protein [Gammaproteobacteria bacterium]